MPKQKNHKTYLRGFFPEFELRRRETGFKCRIGWENRIKYALYSSLLPSTSWEPIQDSLNRKPQPFPNIHHGGVFNLEFSPDGKQLVAACEKNAIMVFDPLTRKRIHDVDNAHSNCVNCIKFLDNRVFASCSDDKTAALWDVRNLKRKIVRLCGHHNWVKNIEYSSEDGLLVTSGFDGRILGWNINSYSENSIKCSELFSMGGLMRMRLTPDMRKLIICSSSGYMVLVNDLSLEHLAEDLNDFQPQNYRLMQLSNYPMPIPDRHKKLFTARRNRLEFISDFPVGNEAEVIHSLQIHPQGWSVLSRNTSSENSSEWTCIHDIQDVDPEDIKKFEDETNSEAKKEGDSNSATATGSSVNHSRAYMVASSRYSNPDDTEQSPESNVSTLRSRGNDVLSSRIDLPIRNRLLDRNDTSDDDDDDEDEEEDQVYFLGDRYFSIATSLSNSIHLRMVRGRRRQLELQQQNAHSETTDDVIPGPSEPLIDRPGERSSLESPSVSNREASDNRLRRNSFALRRRTTLRPMRISSYNPYSNSRWSLSDLVTRPSQVQTNDNESSEASQPEDAGDPPRIISRREYMTIDTDFNDYGAVVMVPRDSSIEDNSSNSFIRNMPRLTNFIEEPNKVRGFIKELCFSSDGRLICSPFDCGVRLLMFDDQCSELSHCISSKPQQLCAVSTNICHSSCVVSTKFSPVDCQLVSGCLNGKIVWHQPVI